jgi:hypothetical protein
MKKNPMKEIAAYCAANIEDYELRVQVALGLIDRMRCPLSQADPSLYDQMEQYASEWAEENDVELDEDFDVEDILWAE